MGFFFFWYNKKNIGNLFGFFGFFGFWFLGLIFFFFFLLWFGNGRGLYGFMGLCVFVNGVGSRLGTVWNLQ